MRHMRSVTVRIPSVLTSNSYGVQWAAYLVRKSWICDQCYRPRTIDLPSNGITAANTFHGGSLKNIGIYHRNKLAGTTFTRYASSEGYTPGSTSNELPSQEERRRSSISRRLSIVMDHVQSNIFIAGQRLNDLTGYSGIEVLKKDIEQQELLVQDTRVALQNARENYSRAISQRSGSQREVNELLQRKHNWTPNDLERFTALYRSDHTNEQTEVAAQANLTALEKKSEEAATRLSASILARYHEEQIWSDKIRRMSTWGTWGLMGVNVLLFLIFQIGVEPWRRKRLLKGFEDKVMEALDRESFGSSVQSEIEEPSGRIVEAPITERSQIQKPEEILPDGQSWRTDTVSDIPTEEVTKKPLLHEEPSTPLATLQVMQHKAQDLFSDRQIVLRRIDLTTATLEGAAIGAVLVGAIFSLLRPR